MSLPRDCDHRLRLPASYAADLLRDGVEGKPHPFDRPLGATQVVKWPSVPVN
jgi:hypothetical protein